MKDSESSLPLNWIQVPIDEVIEKQSLTGIKLKQGDYQEKGLLPVIDQGQRFIGGFTDREELKVPCKLPVVIFGDHTKVLKYVDFDFVAGADGVRVVKPLELLYPKLFYYFLHAIELPDKGYARHFQFLEKSLIPVPPLPEQHRIVARIEELFSRLDAGVQALRRARAQLQRYRQSVLQAAVEGRLTADWRAAHPEVEAAQVSEKQHRPSQKEELPEISDLPILPGKWIWTTFDQVSDRVTVGHVGPMKDEYIKNGIPFLRSQNVRKNKFDPTGLKFISEDFNEKLKKSILHPGDLVVVRSGDVGTACVIPDTLKVANCSDLVIVKQPRAIDPRFAAYYMNSLARARVNSQKVGIALRHFNTKSMAKFPVPVPPLEEQIVIVSLVNKSLNQIDKVEAAIVPNQNYADRLRQSILRRAFQGKLVPQDPNDVPASLLLERIRAERIKESPKRGRKSNANQARLAQ